MVVPDARVETAAKTFQILVGIHILYMQAVAVVKRHWLSIVEQVMLGERYPFCLVRISRLFIAVLQIYW